MLPPPSIAVDSGLTERHIRILDAAERVFARNGFHVATMHDVAAEAGMSPGNLYRYFSSKDAIIAGMAERDRMMIAEDFAALKPSDGRLLDQLEALARKHLVDSPREKAIIALQIWAEAARNPGMAQMCSDIDDTIMQGLADAIGAAKASGELRADLDEFGFLQAMSMMADGFLCRRAMDPDFDPALAANTLFSAMRGLVQVLVSPGIEARSS